MRMLPADIRRFPRFHYYVSTNLPAVAEVRSIIDVMLELAVEGQGAGAGATREQIEDALVWNQGPLIRIVANLQSGGERVNGLYDPTDPEVIQVDEERVTNFERRRNHRGVTAQGRLVFLVGVTLLHELTHWLDNRDGLDNPLEEGDEFETRVYGQFVR